MPKSVERCSTNMSNSSNEPLSSSKLDALARRQLARAVLRRDALLAAAQPRLRAPVLEPFEHVFHGRFSGDGQVRPRLA